MTSKDNLYLEAIEFRKVREIYDAIGPNARRLWIEIGERLVLGAKTYGDFDLGRDWAKEAHEEDLDGVVYRMAQILYERGQHVGK